MLLFAFIHSYVVSGFSQVSTYAGNGATGNSGDGQLALSTITSSPYSVWGDTLDNLYYGENGVPMVRKIAAGTTIVTTVAGNGARDPGNAEGKGTAAAFYYPWGLFLESTGRKLYITDHGSYRILLLDLSSGILTWFVNKAGPMSTSTGDGGAATAATIDQPLGLWGDSNNNIYLTEIVFSKIRKVNSNGIISLFAGVGTAGFTGDGGPATATGLNYPKYLFLDSATNSFYCTSAGDYRVRVISMGGLNMMNTFAGTGVSGSSNNPGNPTSTNLNYPVGISGDTAGSIFIAESNGQPLLVPVQQALRPLLQMETADHQHPPHSTQ